MPLSLTATGKKFGPRSVIVPLLHKKLVECVRNLAGDTYPPVEGIPTSQSLIWLRGSQPEPEPYKRKPLGPCIIDAHLPDPPPGPASRPRLT
jgi:hypothetical protein